MNMNKNKRVFITGINSGIGLEVARIFLVEGFAVTGVVRSLHNLSEGFQEIADQVDVKEVDLSQRQQVQALCADLKDHVFDYIVLNAGIAKIVSTHEETLDELEATMQTNLMSNMQIVRAFLPNALTHQSKIVFVSSLSAHIPAQNFSSYAASKAGLSQYYHSLKREYPDLSLLCLEPGAIDTPLHVKSGNNPTRKSMFKQQKEYAQKMFSAILNKEGVHTLYWDWRIFRTLMRVFK